MRILVVSNFYPPLHLGGYELDCAQVVQGLRERHDVRVLTSRHRAREAEVEPDVCRVLPLGHYRRRDVLRAPVWSLQAVRHARHLADAFEPDVIFIWNGTRIPQAALWALGQRTTPCVYRICEHWFGRLYEQDDFLRFLLPEWSGAKRVWSRLMRLANLHPELRIDLGRRTDAAVAWVSDALRQATPIPTSVNVTRERTIYIGVPPVLTSPEPARPIIGFIGRLSPEKGPDVAIRALHSLRRNHHLSVDLWLIGDGERGYVQGLESLVRRLELENAVHFLGWQERGEVARLMSRLAAVVVPSRWQEPSGTVASEAAAVGAPIVAARSGGMPEYLPDDCARYFEIGDVSGCASALAETINNPADTRARVARARERASDVLRTDTEVRAMEEFLEQAAYASH